MTEPRDKKKTDDELAVDEIESNELEDVAGGVEPTCDGCAGAGCGGACAGAGHLLDESGACIGRHGPVKGG